MRQATELRKVESDQNFNPEAPPVKKRRPKRSKKIESTEKVNPAGGATVEVTDSGHENTGGQAPELIDLKQFKARDRQIEKVSPSPSSIDEKVNPAGGAAVEETDPVHEITGIQALERIGSAQLKGRDRQIEEVSLSPYRIDPHLVAFFDSDSAAATEYQKLAVSMITTALKHPPLKRVLVSSAKHGEGRTCVMLNLAAALARAGQRVLVVDTDLKRPSVNRLLGLDTETGLPEMLREGFHPDLALKRLLPVRFDVLPTRSKVDNTAELLASPDFSATMMALDGHYDFMLFDSAPLLTSSDVNLLILHTHTTLMVVQPGKNKSSEMARAIGSLNEDSIFGVVLNRVSH